MFSEDDEKEDDECGVIRSEGLNIEEALRHKQEQDKVTRFSFSFKSKHLIKISCAD